MYYADRNGSISCAACGWPKKMTKKNIKFILHVSCTMYIVHKRHIRVISMAFIVSFYSFEQLFTSQRMRVCTTSTFQIRQQWSISHGRSVANWTTCYWHHPIHWALRIVQFTHTSTAAAVAVWRGLFDPHSIDRLIIFRKFLISSCNAAIHKLCYGSMHYISCAFWLLLSLSYPINYGHPATGLTWAR